MGTLSARNLTQALSQARNIGLVEEPFVVDNTSVVVRNLRPDQYDSIFKECQGLSDVEYLNAWQMGHVCRAICELNGLDLRDVTTVEEEEADPKRPNQTRTVKVELHSWLQRNVVGTWPREILYICYRKVADAIEAGEKKAQEGITFRVADETPEDKFRRLIGEIKEIEGEVPDRIIDLVLRENGYVRRSTVDEIEAAQSKLSELLTQTDNRAEVEEQEAEKVEVQVPQPPVAAQPPQAKPSVSGPPSAERMAQLLRDRTPMNQPGNPMVTPPAVAPPSVPQGTQQPLVGSRTAELAALEGGLEDMGLDGMPAPVNLQPQAQTPEVRLGSNQRVDPSAAQTILDAPPVGGVNPRFRPPTL